MGLVIRALPCMLCEQAERPAVLCELSFGVVGACPGCGLVRIWPPRSADDLVRLHDVPTYFDHPYFSPRRDLGRPRLVARHRAVLTRLTAGRVAHGGRLLDIGCDTGALLAVARDDFRMDVLGVEISAAAAEVGRRLHQVDVRVGELTTLGLPSASFDFITAIDVLEHTANPLGFLLEIRRILRPGGRLYLVTVDHDAVINTIGLGLSRWLGRRVRPLLERLYIPQHEYYFTRGTLRRLVEKAGLRLAAHHGREFPLDEFAHGVLLKAVFMPVVAVQWLVGRPTLQELVAPE
jgi:SAM-dependent methyltransferase